MGKAPLRSIAGSISGRPTILLLALAALVGWGALRAAEAQAPPPSVAPSGRRSSPA